MSTNTILCVDDEESVLSALKRVFRKTDYNVVIARSAKEAMKILESYEIDLIISDMRMPEVSGGELLLDVTKLWPKVIQILLTGYSEMDAVKMVEEDANIYAMLDKPWDNEKLINTVNEAFKRKKI